jgi:hypothetical protein
MVIIADCGSTKCDWLLVHGAGINSSKIQSDSVRFFTVPTK